MKWNRWTLFGLGLLALSTLLLVLLLRPRFWDRPAHFDGHRAYRDVLAQVKIGPRVAGSAGAAATRAYIESQLAAAGWPAQEQHFRFRSVPLANIVTGSSAPGRILLGAHYDTRPWADHDPNPANRHRPILGANDGASGVAVLLELARLFPPTGKSRVPLQLAFFDAEDRGEIDGWPWSVGAAHFAQQMSSPPSAVVIVDMVGDADQQIYWDGNSDIRLCRCLWQLADQLGYRQWFVPQQKYTMLDDHIPFRQRGLAAVDLIDFDYPFWHTLADTADKVSPQSLQRVGDLLAHYLEKGCP